jgi:thiosulfate dehydrogenase (quinone) large subunit
MMKMIGGICETLAPKAAAVALGRWGLGFVFLFFGVGKLLALRGFVNSYLLPQFARTWLPQWLLVPYGYVLPFVEVALGLLLLLGLARNAALVATGLLLLSLTVGQIVLQQPPVVFQNIAYLFFTAALLFLAKYDLWVLPCCNSKPPDPSGRGAPLSLS